MGTSCKLGTFEVWGVVTCDDEVGGLEVIEVTAVGVIVFGSVDGTGLEHELNVNVTNNIVHVNLKMALTRIYIPHS